MKKYFFSALIIFIFGINKSYSCTSAIFTGKVTKDGRAILWKHRDTGEENNRIEFFKGKKYEFIALVNSGDSGGVVWIGTNSAGFSIMNTASYNLNSENVKDMDKEGILMYQALSECSTVDEFEVFLQNSAKPLGVEANFGVIDAKGGAAYFETGNFNYTKIDVNDPKIAPDGYLVYTNFSYTGRFEEGMGYIRYNTANHIISKKLMYDKVDVSWIFNNLSRSYYHSLLDIDLKENPTKEGMNWFIDQDFIPRKISSASVAIQSVLKQEDVQNTIMWSVLGYPPAGIAVPLWVKGAEQLPKTLIKSSESPNAFACNQALILKTKTFPIKRGNGNKYFKFNEIYNIEESGFMQKLKPYEDQIRALFSPFINKTRESIFNEKELHKLYQKSDSLMKTAYSNIKS